MTANVLACFDLGKARDEAGNEIEINDDYNDLGLITYVERFRLNPFILTTPAIPSHKKSFKCSITPRSPQAVKLVEGSRG